MSETDFDRLYRQVNKGDIPGVVYLYGAEDVLKDEAVDAVIDRAVDASVRDFNVDIRSAATLEAEEAETLCHTLPMMSDRRVVVIRDVESWARRARARATVLRYLTRPAPETVLVLVQGAGEPERDQELAAAGVTFELGSLPAERVQRWLEREARRLEIELEPAAARHLASVCSGELAMIRTELAKLAGFAGGAAITLDLVQQMLGVRHGETQFDWREAVLRGESGRAVTMLPHLLAQPGVSGVSLVMLLGTSLVGLGVARGLYDQGLRSRGLEGAVKNILFKTRPGRLSYGEAAKEWAGLAAHWPPARVDAALRAALRADDRLKNTALSDEPAVLSDLVLTIGLSRREAA